MQEEEFHYYHNQLWTAPELLRMTTRPINGTQKADVYSFAIILQEIMFRAEPYFVRMESSKGKLMLDTAGMLSFLTYFQCTKVLLRCDSYGLNS